MTTQKTNLKNRSILRIKYLFIAIISASAFLIFFYETPVIIEQMKSGLLLCSRVLIPSLFPFMVLSELLIYSKIDLLFEKALGNLFEKIFRVPKCGISALILGLICGFPIGTRISFSLYDQGKINEDELCHLLSFSNIQSSAFIINTVGVSLLGNKNAGIILLISQALSLIICGIIYPRIFVKSTSIPYANSYRHIRCEPMAIRITQAVKGSVLGILNICGFVLFFYVLCGITFDIGMRINLPNGILLTLCSMLEMSCGCVKAATLPAKHAFFVCALTLGFSGFCMHLQMLSLCKDAKIKYGRFFLSKILSATIAGIFAVTFNLIFKIFV